MLEDTEWLSDFAFFTDLLCHMNNLSVKMQGKNQFIDDIWTHLKAFKLKLNLFAGQLAKNDLSHFSRLNSIPSVNEEKLKNYEDGLKKLHFEFERRFQDFSAIQTELDIFTMPFSVNCEAVREREAAKNTVNVSKDDCDDDDDVIIGNPFKSCDAIKAELEEKAKSKALQATTPAVKVIHVSPTNSAEASNREEVILLPQPLNEKVQSLPCTMEPQRSAPERCNGGVISPFTCEDEEVKKKSKKIKKRFKNRIVPEIHDTNNISHISRLNELPPIKPASENVSNGQPCVYMSPKRLSQQNGKINWALAEELEPCRETSLAGCSSRRIEAWSDESYSPI
ncbi:hypothetical protein AVEN_88430-1 [Araneus ventricosus]|uniref:General transcription factor II-I repeat domain-containing protein 2 n=1 Tax=Araneus ventricosus TaxID=182803 RepID=A0A4Y2LCS9_ARAVE|nr:hypothetical protein AVEN_88430-1 [Araneus ventricosus]